MNSYSHRLGKPDDYCDYDGGPIPATRGEGLPFTDIEGRPCHMGMADRTDGKRKIVLRIHTWVGSSARVMVCPR